MSPFCDDETESLLKVSECSDKLGTIPKKEREEFVNPYHNTIRQNFLVPTYQEQI